MPKYLDKTEEKLWNRAKRVVLKQKGRKKLKQEDYPLVMHIMQSMKSAKASELNIIIKCAANIRIEPFESIVDKAVHLVESKMGSGLLASIKNIVLEQGSPMYFGKVVSDKPDTIYISFNKIKTLLGTGASEEDIINHVAEVIAHETGHLASHFQGGEGPAETKEKEFLGKISFRDPGLVPSLIIMADSLDSSGRYGEAEEIDAIVDFLTKRAFYITNPGDISETIVDLVRHFLNKVKPESRMSYLTNMKNKLNSLDPASIAQKAKNPTAGMGATIALVKNLLSGYDAGTVSRILSNVHQRLSKL